MRQCLDSLVGQTFRDMEFVLVDDGSRDGSGRICDAYAAQDPRVKVIHQENRGMPGALNCGLDHATGEWVTFCDSDDWLERDLYERVFQALGDSDAEIVLENGCVEEWSDGSQRKRINFDVPFEKSAGSDMEWVLARTQDYLGYAPPKYRLFGYYWDKLFRRDLLERNGLRFTASAAAKVAISDSLLVFQTLSKARSVKAIDDVGYHYRVREKSLTTEQSYNCSLPDAYLDFHHKLSDSAAEWGDSELIRQAMYARSFHSLTSCLGRTYYNPENPDDRKTTAAKIQALKADPFIHAAIHDRSNQYLQKKHVVLKYILRLPWNWPLETICRIRMASKR